MYEVRRIEGGPGIMDFKMDSNELIFEDLQGERRFFINYGTSDFYEYEKIVLAGKTHPFLTMNFLTLENEYRVYYEYSGCLDLKNHLECFIKNHSCGRFSEEGEFACEIFRILSKSLENLLLAEDHLLFLNRFAFHIENIFIVNKTKEIKLLYIPIKEEMQSHEKVNIFIKELSDMANRMSLSLSLKKLVNTAEAENLGIKQIINCIGQMQRECSITYSLK